MFDKKIIVPEDPHRISSLFYELQEIATDACVPWHVTGEELAAKGLMWVVVRYEVKLLRPFRGGETLRLSTWASPMRHKMTQRNYLAFDEEENCILKAAGIWTVADRETRSMVDAETRGVELHYETNGMEPARPVSPRKLPLTRKKQYIVESDVLDINGHMNNTRYFDLVQDCFEYPGRLRLASVQAVFMSEARLGDLLTVQWGNEGNSWYFTGDKEQEGCFQIGLQYEQYTAEENIQT